MVERMLHMTRRVFGESVQGSSHIRNGRECQDSLKKVEKDENTLILAVADGHGSDSCPYSKTGSEVAVNVFCKIMGDYLETYAGQPELLLTFLKREGDTKVAQAIDAEWKRRILKIHSKYKREIIPNSEDSVLNAENSVTGTEDNKDKAAIYRMYGSTLIGLVITKEFLFAFQLGDGDIVKVSEMGVQNIIEADKILGTETHSLSKSEAWKKVITFIKKQEENEPLPVMYMLSSDGMANSYKNDDEFKKTCSDYFDLLKEHGAKAVSDNLKAWLSETSELGCGDDITALFAYFEKGDCLV
ncbi:MAG: protein phosphatase 2C domain-containing protein [Lachnospiraceae bacterium]|nr:protein phosphatase 2C domain-containing protein [Lachnospiraceae bacterium]